MPEVEPDGIAGSLRAGDGGSSRGRMIAFNWQSGQDQLQPDENTAGALCVGQTPAVAGDSVRRLTPVECARLQGFPDDWNDRLPDTHRYRQFGNAVCVPVAEWLGRRIVIFDA